MPPDIDFAGTSIHYASATIATSNIACGFAHFHLERMDGDIDAEKEI